MIGFEGFLSEVSSKGREVVDRERWQDLVYICASEFGWTERELLEEVSVPFLLDVLYGRKRKFEREERELKKIKRK